MPSSPDSSDEPPGVAPVGPARRRVVPPRLPANGSLPPRLPATGPSRPGCPPTVCAPAARRRVPPAPAGPAGRGRGHPALHRRDPGREQAHAHPGPSARAGRYQFPRNHGVGPIELPASTKQAATFSDDGYDLLRAAARGEFIGLPAVLLGWLDLSEKIIATLMAPVSAFCDTSRQAAPAATLPGQPAAPHGPDDPIGEE